MPIVRKMKMKQNQAWSTTLGGVNVRTNLEFTTYVIIIKTIVKIDKYVAKINVSNVDVDSFKWWLKKGGIQHILVLGKIFFKHVIPKNIFKINGKFTQIWYM